MRRTLTTFVLLLVAQSTVADPTGATDTAILQQLVALLKSANEQVQEFRKQVSISENMQEMEQLKAVKRLADDGRAMKEMINEGQKLNGQLEDLRLSPLGSSQTERDIASLKNQIKDAKGMDDINKAKAYSRMLADLDRLRFLGKAQSESVKKIANGTNEADNTAVAATSTMIMSDLLLQNEEREQRKRVQEVKALTDTLRNMNYSGMVDQ